MGRISDLLATLYFSDDLFKNEISSDLKNISCEEILSVAHEERIFPDICDWFDRCQIAYSFPADLVSRYQNHAQHQLNYQAVITNLVNEDSCNFVVLKGVSLANLYSDGRHRYSADLDILVPDINTAAVIMKISSTLGYMLDSTLLITAKENGEFCGTARLDDEDMWPRGIEIQISRFPITAASWLNHQDIAEEIQLIKFAGVQVPVPGSVGCILVFLAELMLRKRILIRDAYDAKLIFSHYENIVNFAALMEKISLYGLTESVLRLNDFFSKNLLDTHRPTLISRICSQEFSVNDQMIRINQHLGIYFHNFTDKRSVSPKRRKLHYWMERRMETQPQGNLLQRIEGAGYSRKLFAQGILQHALKISPHCIPCLDNTTHLGRWILSLPLGTFAVSPNALIDDEEWSNLSKLCIEKQFSTQ